MKKQYKVKTIAKYIDTVTVEANSEEEAKRLAHFRANYRFSHRYDAVILDEKEIEE